ncbi:hypothetical protein LWI29_016814 [Acer saccharum]|uniref:Secreted protein n=1 Tax=Acer saccharum TaxID=4024 RepID=A0AA39TTI3_ACESA|nr:hypothetical protein LWI29_016814 [Acer saccharum]
MRNKRQLILELLCVEIVSSLDITQGHAKVRTLLVPLRKRRCQTQQMLVSPLHNHKVLPLLHSLPLRDIKQKKRKGRCWFLTAHRSSDSDSSKIPTDSGS